MITARIDAVTAIPAHALRPDAPAPRSVKIELTGRCNYRCGFCALRERETQPVHDMDWAFFQRITAEMHAAGVEELGLFYLGEPFCATDLLVRAVRYVKGLGVPYVFLTTNGSLATPERVQAVMAAGLDSLKFSLNASDLDQFRAVMQVKPSLYSQALEHLRLAREVRDAGGYACGLYASSIRYDGAQQARMEALLDAHARPYVDEHYWLPLYSMGSVATTREAELGYRPIAGNQGRLGALREPLPCWSCFSEGHVTSRGHLSACCFDADDRFTMADLNHVSFLDGWQSPAFKALRAAHLDRDVCGTICAQCIAYRQGGTA
jgi:organic radical activating enzyme